MNSFFEKPRIASVIVSEESSDAPDCCAPFQRNSTAAFCDLKARKNDQSGFVTTRTHKCYLINENYLTWYIGFKSSTLKLRTCKILMRSLSFLILKNAIAYSHSKPDFWENHTKATVRFPGDNVTPRHDRKSSGSCRFFFIVCKDKSNEGINKETILKTSHSDVHQLCY